MPAYDSGFKIAARVSGRELAEVAGLSCSRWRPIVSEVQITERFADRAFRATSNGQRCVVYFEAYTQWRKNALWNVQSKASMLSERERLPTVTVLYILRPRGYEQLDGQFLLKVGQQPTQSLWYYPVPLWQQQPADWWKDCPGLMALYPLAQHGRQPQDAIRYAADTIRVIVAEENLQTEMLTSLGFFGRLAYPHINVFQLIERAQMKESKFVHEIFAEEFQELRRTTVLEVLEERFGKEAAEEFSPALAKIADERRLARLHRLAVRCTDLEAFRAGLTQR